MRPGSFNYKGVSSLSFKIISKSVNRPMLPKMQPRTAEIYGKHGAIDFGKNNYGTRHITMHIAYIGNNFTELRSRTRDIAAWLTSKQWERLIFNDEPDKYYQARIYDQVGLANLGRVGEADIIFECQPFANMVISTAADPTCEEANFPGAIDMPGVMVGAYRFVATGLASFDFEHPGAQEMSYQSPQGSQFNVVVTGTWTTLSLTMNGKTLTYAEAGTGTLVIKNVDMEVELDGANKLDAVDGDLDNFLSIVPGTNTIHVAGTDLNVRITLDFISLWL